MLYNNLDGVLDPGFMVALFPNSVGRISQGIQYDSRRRWSHRSVVDAHLKQLLRSQVER